MVISDRPRKNLLIDDTLMAFPEETLFEGQQSLIPFTRKKTIKVPKKVKTYTPYEVESWANVPIHEKNSFGMDVDDLIDIFRKKEERLKMKRIKPGV